jgi:hypothetical protein
MQKNTLLLLLAIAVTAIFLVLVSENRDDSESATPPTPSPAIPLFSGEANEIFVSSVAGDVDLNSGITMERPASAIPEQINNVGFAVFNHTDEPILFPDQGFGLTVFRYDEIARKWENLPLRYVPHVEPTILSARIETWSDVDKTWAILEDETTAWGYKHVRIYVSGTGQMTNKTYGAYLDVTISLP